MLSLTKKRTPGNKTSPPTQAKSFLPINCSRFNGAFTILPGTVGGNSFGAGGAGGAGRPGRGGGFGAGGLVAPGAAAMAGPLGGGKTSGSGSTVGSRAFRRASSIECATCKALISCQAFPS